MTAQRVAVGQRWQVCLIYIAGWTEVTIEQIVGDLVTARFGRGAQLYLVESVMLAEPDKYRLIKEPE